MSVAIEALGARRDAAIADRDRSDRELQSMQTAVEAVRARRAAFQLEVDTLDAAIAILTSPTEETPK